MGLFRGHTVTNRADKIANFTVSTAEYGQPVPEVIGTTRMSGNVIYYDDFTAHEHKETQRAGKGGGSKVVNITYTYTVACIIGLCEGPVAGIGKVWRDKELYQYPADAIQMTLFSGTQNQQPWAYTQGKHPEKALAYPGLAYMAGVLDLGTGGSMPNFNFEVKGKLLETGDGVDVNPADYIQYIFQRIGLGDAKIEGLDNYRKYCREADMLISSPPDMTETRTARDIINDIASITNAYIFWSNDQFKIVPLADRPVGSWEPNKTITYDLTPDDFLPQSGGALVTYQRKDSAELYNQFSVEFINRANSYEKESVSFQLEDDVKNTGLRQASVTQAHYLYKKERAVRLAEQLARDGQYGRNRYTFKLDWAFCRLEVGDLVTLTDPQCGLDKQVALIDSVTEDETGCLTFTAISRPAGDYGPAVFDVHENDRPYVDYNGTAPDTATPVIFQPPADLTTDGLELWIGAKGTKDGWGGCTVWVSDDDEHYRMAGQITNSARIGTTAKAMKAEDTSVEVTVNGTLLSGTEQDAERGNTLCWIDGECLSYTTATLIAEGRYRLDGLVRGQYTTTAAAHPAGATFCRMDNTLLKAPFRKEDIGKKIWLKFTSYNIFGAGEQSLADVNAYQYTIQAYYIPPVTDLIAYNRYRQLQDGVSRYDIVVSWMPPELESYLQGDVWYKTNHAQATDITIEEGKTADELGFDGEWIFGGSGKNQVVIPQAIVGDTYRIAVCTKDEWGAATTPDLVPKIDILVALKTTVPNTPDGFSISFSSAATVSWGEVTNADVAFYEVRMDANPGVESPGLLARTTGVSTTILLTSRTGKLYLYAKSAIGKYSLPATLEYNKALPPTPRAPTLTAKLGGFSLVEDAISTGCIGMTVYIDGQETQSVHTVNNTLTYTCSAGIYDVTCAYTDLFGEGAKSPSSRITVKATVDSSLLAQGAVSMDKVEQALQETIRTGGGANDKIVQLVTDLNDPEKYKKYTAFVQLNDAIELRVKSDEVVSKINLSPAGTTIDGRLLHVTGDTLIDNNLITKGMIQAKAISADKLDVQELSAITATIGTLRTATSGARTEIRDNLILVYDSNNVLRVRMGVW